jgi:hypothetical protein
MNRWGINVTATSRVLTGLLAAALNVAAAPPLWAAEPAQSTLLPEVLAAANGIGMVRGARVLDYTAINYVLYQGSGTLLRNGKMHAVTSYELSADYLLPAIRIDATVADAKPARTIEVVREQRAWDETEPGVAPVERKGNAAAQRLLQLYATPIGALVAAIRTDQRQIKVTRDDGNVMLRFSKSGVDIRITLDSGHRPALVEVANRAGSLAASYPEYRDFEGYFAFHPARIIQRVGGKVVLDMAVTNAYSNPYVAFPTPEQLVDASASRH